jgi:ribosomal-protein-alanine N-acetyltransferase
MKNTKQNNTNNSISRPRILREGDLSSLLDLEMQSFPIDHWSKEIFLSELKNKNAVIKVLKCEGKVVGYIHTEFSDRQFGGKKIRVGEIGSLAVAQDHRGKKLGEKLMRHGLRSLKKNDTSTIVLQTRLDNVIVKSMAEN